MKQAYLILCHKNPQQVGKLVDQLLMTEADVYVHIDKKNKNFSISERENLYIIPEKKRVNVSWSGISMIEAEMVLLAEALLHGEQYTHMVLLSGEDVLVKEPQDIHVFFENNRVNSFIEIIDERDKRLKRYKKRNEVVFSEFLSGNGILARLIKNVYIICTGGYGKTFKLFLRKNITGLSFAYGSQWWALNYDCAYRVSRYWKEHPEVLSFFSKSMTPDECVIQTLVRTFCNGDTLKNTLTYVNWGKNRNHPDYLDKNMLDIIKGEGNYLFARKWRNE